MVMQGSFCRFYVRENDHHHGRPVWEWLLEQANRLVRGGSAFRAMAGFGRQHVLHENHFFELAGTLAVEVEFIVTEDESRQLLELLRREHLRLFYSIIPARFGVTGDDADDPAPAAVKD
jgi:PII-like signaling protein